MKNTADGIFLTRPEHDSLFGKPLLELLIAENPTYKWNLGGVKILGISPVLVEKLGEFFSEKLESEKTPKPIEEIIEQPEPDDLSDSGFTEEEIADEFGGVRSASEEPLAGFFDSVEIGGIGSSPEDRWDLPPEINI